MNNSLVQGLAAQFDGQRVAVELPAQVQHACQRLVAYCMLQPVREIVVGGVVLQNLRIAQE